MIEDNGKAKLYFSDIEKWENGDLGDSEEFDKPSTMNNKIRKRLDRVTQLDSKNLPMLSGVCVINGIERKVAAFKAGNDVSGAGLEKALLEQAYTEREYQLTDWMKGSEGDE